MPMRQTPFPSDTATGMNLTISIAIRYQKKACELRERIPNDLVEIVEIPDHPWFVAVQFHPEFKSKPHAAHPLFANFIAATLKYKR